MQRYGFGESCEFCLHGHEITQLVSTARATPFPKEQPTFLVRFEALYSVGNVRFEKLRREVYGFK